MDTCAGGLYNFASVSTILVTLDTIGTVGPFQLTGTTKVWLGTGSPHSIETELVSINETASGVTLTAGDGIGNLLSDGPLFSPGHIDEQAGSPALADSFFDVFFQIDVPAISLSLHNTDPLQVVCRGLETAPPRTCAYDIVSPTPLALFDVAGINRGQLLATPPDFHHHVVEAIPDQIPEPGTWLTLLAGAGLLALGRKRRIP